MSLPLNDREVQSRATRSRRATLAFGNQPVSIKPRGERHLDFGNARRQKGQLVFRPPMESLLVLLLGDRPVRRAPVERERGLLPS